MSQVNGRGADVPRILILKTGTTFPRTRRRFGDFDRWFLDALRGCPARFDVHDVTTAPPSRLAGYHGVIVTGSPAAVYDRAAWMGPISTLLCELAEQQSVPTLAVCFAAQALAQALGGRVERCPDGWEIGTVRVRLTAEGRRDTLFRGDECEVCVQATHQDWITEVPSGTLTLAENDRSPIQAFRIGERVWGTQFHPEGTAAILEDLVRARREVLLSDAGGGSRGEARYREILLGLAPSAWGGRLLDRFVHECSTTEPLPLTSG
jgi:GMP synthase (glutamine-hydrolysing)